MSRFFAFMLAMAMGSQIFASEIFAPKKIIFIPFQTVGKLIMVKAEVEGKAGLIIVDTGAPQIILNSAHFDGLENTLTSSTTGVEGTVPKTAYLSLKSFKIKELEVKNQMARVIDLSHLERSKGIEILGLVGFSVFRKHELHFDFRNKQIVLIPLSRKGWPLVFDERFAFPTDSIEFKMTGHLPYVEGFIGDKKVKLGLDSGTEATVLLNRVLKNRVEHFTASNRVIVRGVSQNNGKQAHGLLNSLQLGLDFHDNLEIVILNVPKLEGFGHVDLDGLLAISQINDFQIAINYKKKVMYLWDEEKIFLTAKKGREPQKIIAK